MAFERLSRIFRRRRQDAAEDGEGRARSEEADRPDRDAAAYEEPAHRPTVDKPGSQAVLIDQMEDGFKYIGQVMDKVDRHIDHQSHVMENFRQVAELLPEMVQNIGDSATTNRALSEQMRGYIGEHDQAQQNLLHGLRDLNQVLREEREQHRGQLDIVLRVHRSQRRFMSLLLLLLVLVCAFLLLLVLAMAIRPDLFSERFAGGRPAGRSAGGATPSAFDVWKGDKGALLEEAAASSDPEIRRMATAEP